MTPRRLFTPWRIGIAALVVAALPSLQSRADGPKRGGDVERIAQRGGGGIQGGLEGGRAWINTGGDIHLADLKGKIVLLDFWTLCCINCHHVLPELAALEAKYPNELVVIGVHTGKFDAEKDTDNIRQKVREYRINHPVVNDADQIIWRRFGVSSWPTVAVIDANGNFLGALPGEGNGKKLDNIIADLIAKHRAKGELDEIPLSFKPESDRPHESPLHYPGKVLADPDGKRLFISDTGNNRIVVADLDGKVLHTIGGGAAGMADGTFEKATFNRQQGLCLLDGTLYVADTESHAIRAIDLKAQKVRTVAGTSEQGYLPRNRKKVFGPAKETELSSPWDLAPAPEGKALYIAMAGIHQIWKLDLEKETVGTWAGTGREDIIDGAHDGDRNIACFAQPSGLATDGKSLFVADSEGSVIREIPFGAGQKVRTIVGAHDITAGQTLFEWGDVDAVGNRARLQHDLGVAYHDGKLFIADTYNNKIKSCDLKSHAVKALAGSPKGDAGKTDVPSRFDQPGGLSVEGSTLFVADTNNHAIRAIDIPSGEVRTLKLEGLETPKPKSGPPKFLNKLAINAPAAKAPPGKLVTLDVSLDLPAGLKLNSETPMTYLVEAPKAPDFLASSDAPRGERVDPPSQRFQISVPLAKEARAGDSLPLKISLSTFQCRDGSDGFCKIQSYVWTVPITFDADANGKITLTIPEAKASK